jgi:hypothetical protein
VRWTLADAFERTGQPDSAAANLERDLAMPYIEPQWAPAIRYRLVLLYARMGRVPEAERHLAALEHAWDRPDPEVRRMLDEARAALASARGMARPEGRAESDSHPARTPSSPPAEPPGSTGLASPNHSLIGG